MEGVMTAGRELDGLVAERVFGYGLLKYMTNPPRPVIVVNGQMEMRRPGKEHTEDVPRYSRDIAAAWEVVAKVCERKEVEHLRLIVNESGAAATFSLNKLADFRILPTAYCNTAAEAICHAAVTAVDALSPARHGRSSAP